MALKIYLKNIPFEFERDICRTINLLLKRRPSSAPYLTGDTFRTLATHLYDETHRFTATDVTENAIIFVKSDFILEFEQKILFNIQKKCIIINHNSDVNITNTDTYKKIADNPNIIHWFAQNCTLKHPKVIPLPIGLENAWCHNAGALRDFKKYKNHSQKQAKILMGFSLGTNADARFTCYRAFWRQPTVTEIMHPLNAHLYRKLLVKHQFVASPVGNGLDCHRTWEAMYLGVIPLVEDNYMHRYFASLGLPLIIVDNWNTWAKKTPTELQNAYETTIQNAKKEALYFNYWKNLITKAQ